MLSLLGSSCCTIKGFNNTKFAQVLLGEMCRGHFGSTRPGPAGVTQNDVNVGGCRDVIVPWSGRGVGPDEKHLGRLNLPTGSLPIICTSIEALIKQRCRSQNRIACTVGSCYPVEVEASGRRLKSRWIKFPDATVIVTVVSHDYPACIARKFKEHPSHARKLAPHPSYGHCRLEPSD